MACILSFFFGWEQHHAACEISQEDVIEVDTPRNHGPALVKAAPATTDPSHVGPRLGSGHPVSQPPAGEKSKPMGGVQVASLSLPALPPPPSLDSNWSASCSHAFGCCACSCCGPTDDISTTASTGSNQKRQRKSRQRKDEEGDQVKWMKAAPVLPVIFKAALHRNAEQTANDEKDETPTFGKRQVTSAGHHKL
eukprot:TRINITY_DN19362_c0_g1_i1.p1 TRINITY_DN19362_c0_g1~~TRINITY_DN19362_c0_g1_i1.p1  ORF type:complete len:194 (-),score=42.18 TRINITY_DN19362_c0_g1_i1:29-610(-)